MLQWLKRKKEEQEPEAYDIITYQSMQVLEIIRDFAYDEKAPNVTDWESIGAFE